MAAEYEWCIKVSEEELTLEALFSNEDIMFHLDGNEVSGLKETKMNIIAKFSTGLKWLHNNINNQFDLYSVLIDPIYKISSKLCSVYASIVYSLTLRLNNNLTYLHTLLIKNKGTLHFIPVNSFIWLLLPIDNGK